MMYLCFVIEQLEKLDYESLLNFAKKQQFQIDQQHQEIKKLQHQLEQLIRYIYGQKSEKFVANPDQTSLSFDLPAIEQKEQEKETITYDRKKKSETSNHKGRLPIPDHLPRVDEVIEPSGDLSGLTKIGKEVTERLECEPGKLFVKRFIRPKYAKENNEGVVIAQLPSSPIEKGRAGASVLSMIIIQKYLDHLPLYRQIEQFRRMGIEIPSSTMSDWMKKGAELITPLYETLVRRIVRSEYLQADETRIQVLDKEKKGKTHRGWYWTFRDPVSGLVCFDYHESRGREGPEGVLKNLKGFLQTDGYEVYNHYDRNNITLLHCMAHARRYFEQALGNDRDRATFVMQQMQKLYAVEKHCREHGVDHAQRLSIRKEQSVPVLQTLHEWLKEHVVQVAPASAIGKAISYALPRWEKLMLYTTDGRLEIDNNLVENSIRPIAIGRKNYLFAGSHESAQNAAMFYSLIGTCKLKDIEPFLWLKNLFEILPDYKVNRLEELLP
jgi:transposase